MWKIETQTTDHPDHELIVTLLAEADSDGVLPHGLEYYAPREPMLVEKRLRKFIDWDPFGGELRLLPAPVEDEPEPVLETSEDYSRIPPVEDEPQGLAEWLEKDDPPVLRRTPATEYEYRAAILADYENLTPMAQLTGVQIVLRCWERWELFAGMPEVAQWIGLAPTSQKTVTKYVRELEEAGYLQRIGRSRRAVRYRLTLPD